MTSQRAPSANNSSAANPFVKWLLTDAWAAAKPDDLVTNGDAALAIFPISCESAPRKEACAPKEQACAHALNAARDARNRMRQLNEQRNTHGQASLGFGLALHVGDLMYGNIGVPERL